MSFSRQIDPQNGPRLFPLSAQLNFAILEKCFNSLATDDRWERRAAVELADELCSARLVMCSAVPDAIAENPISVEESIEQLKRVRANRFAEVTRLFDELKTLPTPTLPAIHVTIRALSRLAA